MTITMKEICGLPLGYELHHRYDKNADGTPCRWRINGKVKLWKTRPTEFKAPIKRGLKEHSYVTHNEIHHYCLTSDEVYRADTIAFMDKFGCGRKVDRFEDAPYVPVKKLECYKHLPRFTFDTLYGEYHVYPCRNFGAPIDAQVFILENDLTQEEYLINTEGYPYCRYITKIK